MNPRSVGSKLGIELLTNREEATHVQEHTSVYCIQANQR